MLEYYGVDWLIFVFIAIHLWLLSNRRREAFLFGVLGTICSIILGFLVNSIAVILMNCIFVVMHTKAYLKWTKYN